MLHNDVEAGSEELSTEWTTDVWVAYFQHVNGTRDFIGSFSWESGAWIACEQVEDLYNGIPGYFVFDEDIEHGWATAELV